MIRKYLYTATAGILLFSAIGCTKKFVDDTILPVGTINSTNSSIRIFNLVGFPMDVTVNNVPLTFYTNVNGATGNAPPVNITLNGSAAGLGIFPSGVWNDGTSFTVPSTLLDKSGKAIISMAPRIDTTTYPFVGHYPFISPPDTVLANNPLNPVDYYVLSDGHVHALPRSPAVPSEPYNFKIRVVNWSSPTDTLNLAGPMSVTYADGTAVDPALTNVFAGQTTNYVELPYGAIEFKVFANRNLTQQLSELPVKPYYSAVSGGPFYDQEARFGPVRIFKPGGVYTIFISSNAIYYTNGYCNIQYYVPINSYHVISENSPGVNFTYAQVRGVNVYPMAGSLTVTIDGQPLGQSLAYGEHTGDSIVVQGTHVVSVLDATGNVVVKKNFTFYPYDNVTAWVFQRDSVPDICFSPMDMSQVNTGLLFDCLNLCSGLPYLTFTNDAYPFHSTYYNTSNQFDTSATNLALGQQVLFDRYHFENLTPGLNGSCGSVSFPVIPSFSMIRAYQSDVGPPLQVPGSLLDQIPPVYPYSFIANPSLYSSSPGPVEPGAYTIALIGKLSATAPDPFAPRIVILKHNK